MASNSKAFVSFAVTTGDCPQNPPLSGSVPIRAPLTLSGSDSELDVSSNASLSDSASYSDDAQTSRPLVPHPHSDSYPFQEEGSSEVDEDGSSMQGSPLRVMPFAHLSTYRDDEEEEVEEEKDEILSVARVPGSFVSAPRIKVLDLDEDEENAESLTFVNSLPVSQSLLANQSSFSSETGSGDFIEAENDIANVRIHKELVSDEFGVLGIRAAYDEYSIATDTDAMSQYSQDNFNNEQVDMVRVVLDELDNDGMNLYCVDREEGIAAKLIETDTILQRKLVLDTRETIDMVEGTSVMVDDTSLLKPNAEDYPEQNTSVIDLQEQNSQIHNLTGKAASEVFVENIDFSATTQSNAANGSQVATFDQGGECENLVSISSSMINSKDTFRDCSVGFESNDDACEGNKIKSIESSETFDSTLLQECTYLEKDLSKTILAVSLEDEAICDYHSHENVETINLGDTAKEKAVIELNTVCQERNRDGSASDEDVEGFMPVGLELFREQISALSILLGSKGFGKNSQEEQTIRSSCGTTNLPKNDAKMGVQLNGNTETVTSAEEPSVIFLKDPAGFNSLPHCDAQVGFQHNLSEKEKEKIQKIQAINVKFLRLVRRINLSPEDSLVSKVLCRLVADIERRLDQEFVIESAKISAKKLEEDCQGDLDFSLNILVLGKSGMGKSATINSIFGDMKVMTNAFEPATNSVKEISGTIDGVKIRIFDTPGLRSPVKEQAFNRKILSSIKRYMRKFPPDVVLYVDRLDSQTRDLNDVPLLRSITSSLGASVWQHAVLTLTHAASTPLDGPTGSPLSYEVFVAQKSYLVQQLITQAVGDLCQLSPSFMCPVSLVENHPLCGKNLSGDCVLPSGLRWRSKLLVLCFSMKILSEVSSVSGPQTLLDHWKHFFFRDHSQPLHHQFSSLLQSPDHLKFSANWN